MISFTGIVLLIRKKSRFSSDPLNNDPHRYQRVFVLAESLDPVLYVDNDHCDPYRTSRDTQIMNCIHNYENKVMDIVNEYVETRVIETMDNILQNRTTNCFDAKDTLMQTIESREHHFTLYYYDQAGNLIQTTPPEAFDISPIEDPSNPDMYLRNENYNSKYLYNSFNQIVNQEAPERGLTEITYDRLQNPRFSQNAKQKAEGSYTYMKYDHLNRLIEQGEFVPLNGGDINQAISNDDKDYPRPVDDLDQKDIVRTFYTVESALANELGIDQGILRNRISYQERLDNYDMDAEVITCAYAYDIHGNVKVLMHDYPWIPENPIIEYDYDLISGNVHKVSFKLIRPWNRAELGDYAFYHRYFYDDDNRITQVYTSKDDINWEEQARYFYYLHGPMARVELGHDKIQGMDYVYTLQGWIKSVNLPGADTQGSEPGADGHRFEEALTDNAHGLIGRDAVAYNLGYNEEDYRSIAKANNPMGDHPFDDFNEQHWQDIAVDILNSSTGTEGLYNGNIASMSSDLKLLANADNSHTYAYKYDQLHRIIQGKSYLYDGTSSQYSGNLDVEYTYDQNGNLLQLKRAGLDDLSYDYSAPNRPNLLMAINNASTSADAVPADNYDYDEIGNLISSNEATNITWDHYDKVETVLNNQGIETGFVYDPMGNRVLKRSSEFNSEDDLYIRDAQGNELVIMKIKYDGSDTDRKIRGEYPIYGSDHIGIQERKYNNHSILIGYEPALDIYRRKTSYQLKNHLGNVLTTVSDQKLFDRDGAADNSQGHYVAQAVTVSDYYPFGHQIEERSSSTHLGGARHRYGFNDKELDSDGEWGTSTTQYDYGFRIYNPGIARFLSVDPLTGDYPSWSPYPFAMNRPINGIDLDGKEWQDSYGNWTDEYNGRYVQLASGTCLYSRQVESGQHQYWKHDGERWIDQ